MGNTAALSAAGWLIVAFLAATALMYAFAGLLARSRRNRARNRAAIRRLEKRQEWNDRVVRYASQFPGFSDPQRRGDTIAWADRHMRSSDREWKNRTAR